MSRKRVNSEQSGNSGMFDMPVCLWDRRIRTKEQVVMALRMSGGIVTEAAKMLRVTARVIYKWIDEDEEIGDKTLRTEMNVNRGMLVDLAETELIKKIKQGDNPSIVFTLRSLGKDRGWIDKVVEKREKKEEGKKEEMKVNVSEMRDEDLEELAEGRVPDGLRILEGGSRK